MVIFRHLKFPLKCMVLVLYISSIFVMAGCVNEGQMEESKPSFHGAVEVEIVRIGRLVTKVNDSNKYHPGVNDLDGSICMVVATTNNTNFAVHEVNNVHLAVASTHRESIFASLSPAKGWRGRVSRAGYFSPGDRTEHLVTWQQLERVKDPGYIISFGVPYHPAYKGMSSGSYWELRDCVEEEGALRVLRGQFEQFPRNIAGSFFTAVSGGVHPWGVGGEASFDIGSDGVVSGSLCELSPIRFKVITPLGLVKDIENPDAGRYVTVEKYISEYLGRMSDAPVVVTPSERLLSTNFKRPVRLTTGHVFGAHRDDDRIVHYRPIGLDTESGLKSCAPASSG